MALIILGLLTVLLCCGDLYCKSWIEKHLRKGDKEKIGKGILELRRVHNEGFALNFCENKPRFVRVFSVIVCVIVGAGAFFVWKKERCFVKRIAVAFILAGAISNTYDRIKREYVVDYIGVKTKCNKLNRLTFNLADFFLFVGAVGYALADVFGE